MIGVTIASGDPLYTKLAEEARKRFMAHTGLSCVVLHTQHNRNYSAKLQLWKMFAQTEQSFCFFDCDCWAVKNVNLEQYDDREEFFAVTDSVGQDITPEIWTDSFTHKDAVRHGIPFEKMFNGGFWIANGKRHREVFETALRYIRDPEFEFDDFGEQSAMSLALRDLGVPVEHLPVHFNTCFGGSTPLDRVCSDPYFIHAAGVVGERKLELLKGASS